MITDVLDIADCHLSHCAAIALLVSGIGVMIFAGIRKRADQGDRIRNALGAEPGPL